MSFPSLLRRQVTVVTYTTGPADVHGNEQRVVSRRRTYSAWVDEVASDEDTRDRDRVVSTILVMLPGTAQVGAGDRVLWQGREYDVTGVPATLYRPSGLHHFEVRARLVGQVPGGRRG